MKFGVPQAMGAPLLEGRPYWVEYGIIYLTTMSVSAPSPGYKHYMELWIHGEKSLFQIADLSSVYSYQYLQMCLQDWLSRLMKLLSIMGMTTSNLVAFTCVYINQ